jgi:hypothetical protein
MAFSRQGWWLLLGCFSVLGEDLGERNGDCALQVNASIQPKYIYKRVGWLSRKVNKELVER